MWQLIFYRYFERKAQLTQKGEKSSNKTENPKQSAKERGAKMALIYLVS